MSALNDLKSWSKNQNAPVTLALVASFVGIALLFWFTGAKDLINFAVTRGSHEQPWQFITYAWAQMPFADGLSILFFVFLMMWLFSFGAPIEKMMGRQRFIGFFATMLILAALSMWIGMNILNTNRAFNGAYIPISAVTMVWCARNMNQTIMLNGFIPLSGKWLAVVDAVVAVLIYGNGTPLLGVFAVVPLGFAFAYGRDILPYFKIDGPSRAEVHAARAQAQYKEEYFDDVRDREKERADRERLRKLLEGSIKDED